MKKIVLLLIAVITAYITTNGQKAGILKIDDYGAFKGDDYLDFLAGRRATDFQQKSTITLVEYNKLVDSTVKAVLSEPSVESAINNSTVKDFPVGATVYTSNNKGVWKSRTAYAGESGLYHEPTGIYWLSFKCGNPTAFGSLPKKTAVQPATLTSVPSAPALANPTGNITLTVNGTTGASQDLTWRVAKPIYDEGRMDYRLAIYDAMALQQMQSKILIDMQNSKQCCGQTAPPAPLAPNMYLTSVPANVDVNVKEKVPFGQTLAGQFLANTLGEVAGTYLVRGIDRLTGRSVVYRYRNDGVLLNTYPFKGGNQPTYSNTGSGSIHDWANTWRGDGLNVVSFSNPTIRHGF